MSDIITDIFLYFVTLLIFAPIGFLVAFFQRRKERYISALARKYGLEYKKGEWIDLMRGFRSRLFKYSKTIAVKDVFVGEYQNQKFNIFTKWFYSPKSSKINHFTIASCEFKGTEFPHILLKNKKMPLYQNPENIDTKISLEQKFLANFDLYCPKDYEIEALQIFTEDLISSIQEISDTFSIELGGDRIYVYLNKDIHKTRNEKDFAKILNILKKIIEKTDGLLFRLKDDFEALDAFYKK